MPYLPFGITHRKNPQKAVRFAGYKAFINDLEIRGYYGDYLNANIFNFNIDHVLGTETQVTNSDASIYYDGSDFLDVAGNIVILFPYDRILFVMTALERSITFPNIMLFMNNHQAMSLAGFTITIPGTIDGEIDITGAAGTLTVSGVSNVLIVTRTSATLNFTGSGSVIDNGVIV